MPIPFRDLLDPATGRTRLRFVNIHSTRYAIARRYMIRLRRDDFESADDLAKIATGAGLDVEQLRSEFEYLTLNEPPPLVLEAEGQDLPEASRERLPLS